MLQDTDHSRPYSPALAGNDDDAGVEKAPTNGGTAGSSKTPAYVYFCAACASLNSVLLGYATVSTIADVLRMPYHCVAVMM